MHVDQVQTEFFMDCVPPIASMAMEILYGNIFSSLDRLDIYGNLKENVSTYVAWKDGKPLAVLLFRHNRHSVRVLNETVYIPAEELQRFSDHVFMKLPSATVILFHAIRTGSGNIGLPCQRFVYSEDIIVPLPRCTDEYVKSLGKSTRKNIKHHLSRVKRAFPSFQYKMYAAEEVEEQHIREIIRFNRIRFDTTDNPYFRSDRELERLIRLVRIRGMVGIATIEGKICGGAICTHVGDNYFSHVASHDAQYDSFRLGTLCCFLAVCECIQRGGEEFHFLWGKDDYKFKLGGIEHDLEDVLVYRSWTQYLRRADMVFKAACNGYARKMKVWMQNGLAQPKSGVGQFMQLLLSRRRKHKRFVP